MALRRSMIVSHSRHHPGKKYLKQTQKHHQSYITWPH